MTKGGFLLVPFYSLKRPRYTSLGSTYNTFPNPALRVSLPHEHNLGRTNGILRLKTDSTSDKDSSTSKSLVQDTAPVGCCLENKARAQPEGKLISGYRPAYELMDGSLERCGRGPSQVPKDVN
jgi:FAD synthetase